MLAARVSQFHRARFGVGLPGSPCAIYDTIDSVVTT
jgi:hypothetical protein